MLTVIAIIGILASIFMPMISGINGTSKVTATAADFRTFANAFKAYSMLEGGWPPDSHNSIPLGVGMEAYLSAESFNRDAAIGGRYNWEGPDNYTYAGISLTTTSASTEDLEALDDILDDGNLSSGWFRLMGNGRYTLIIEDNI